MAKFADSLTRIPGVFGRNGKQGRYLFTVPHDSTVDSGNVYSTAATFGDTNGHPKTASRFEIEVNESASRLSVKIRGPSDDKDLRDIPPGLEHQVSELILAYSRRNPLLGRGVEDGRMTSAFMVWDDSPLIDPAYLDGSYSLLVDSEDPTPTPRKVMQLLPEPVTVRNYSALLAQSRLRCTHK